MFRVFLSQQRTPSHLPVVTALLQRWLAGPRRRPTVSPTGPRGARPPGPRHPAALPAIGDLARSARFRWFEAPIVRPPARRPTPRSATSSTTSSEHPTPTTTPTRVDALVASPEPLVRFLAERIAAGVPAEEPLVEVLARRHYREHDCLLEGAPQACRGRPCLVGHYAMHEARTRLVSTGATSAT